MAVTTDDTRCRLCGSAPAGPSGYCRHCAEKLRREIYSALPELREKHASAETQRLKDRWTSGRLRTYTRTTAATSRRLNEYLYVAGEVCPVCDQTFQQAKVNWSRLKVESHDTDFYTRYTDFSPYPYTVWVCSHCSYAAPLQAFREVTALERQAIKDGFGGRRPKDDFSGLRDLDLAVKAFKLALYTTRFRLPRYGADLINGALWLRLAWLYRENDRQEEEIACLREATEAYVAAYQGDVELTGGMSRLKVMYLIGELKRRTGDLEEARRWLSRLVSSQDLSTEPAVSRLARQQWQLLRQQMSGKGAAGQEEG